MKASSDVLYQFYCAWLEEAEARADDSSVAGNMAEDIRCRGLCHSAIWSSAFDAEGSQTKPVWDAQDELAQQFYDAGLDCFSPFHDSLGDYIKEGRVAKSHLNPDRLAWVKARIADYENAYFPNPR